MVDARSAGPLLNGLYGLSIVGPFGAAVNKFSCSLFIFTVNRWQWKQLKPMTTIIGKINLPEKREFTQYGEHAAWTDYITCEPQTVDLKYDGYWVFAGFDGVLTGSSYPSGAREIGGPARALVQTQAWGGIGNWKDRITLSPGWEFKQVGAYDDGKPMFALAKSQAN